MIDLFQKIPLLKRIARLRWLQFALVFPTLVLFCVFLYAGVFGTPVGNRNIIVVFVWILWWILLIAFMVPFASRVWCLVCPFPIIGEWIQRGSFIRVRRGESIRGLKNRYFGLNKPWPKKRRNIWLQNVGFMCLAVFSPFLVTRPLVSVGVLGGLFVVATILAVIFRQRAFCMYLCPVGGFLGLYSMTSKLALRANDVEICNRIKEGREEEFSFDYGIAACRLACPTGMDASSYIALIRNGRYKEAIAVIRDATPFAGVLGRVCTHPCEPECVRGQFDEPISICGLKRFAADREGYDDLGPAPLQRGPNGSQKVAVIGGGPAGLSCAYHLRRKGFEVDVYEALPVAGGMLRVGIPDYKLPKEIVDKEIDLVRKSGVTILTNITVGKDIDFAELQRKYQAIFVAIGASESRRLKIGGEDLKGVYNAIDILRRINLGERVELGSKVIIIGGGDTAIDVARSVRRLGGQSVIVYRRSREEMPAIPDEIAGAEEEGVSLQYLTAPVKMVGSNGTANALLCVKMRLGEPDETGRPRPVPIKGSEHLVSADSIIVATGQYSDLGFLPPELSISSAGTVIIDPETAATNVPGVFAGGDVVSGPDVLVKALGVGRKAALSIEQYLKGEQLKPVSLYPSEKRVEEVPVGTIDRERRVESARLPVAARLKDFSEVEQVFTEEMAKKEAKRCLSCGICGACYRGTDTGWSCAWHQKMGDMDRNNYCGLCMECVKSCPYDNIGLYWRPFAQDTRIKGYDEAWKSFIMMVLAVVYSVNLLGPWGKVKDWANFTESGNWQGFVLLSLTTLLTCGVVFPSLHYLFCRLSKAFSRSSAVEMRDLFVQYSYAYVPLGLMAWIAFSVPLLLINGSYIVSVVSDPMGWGWDLFRTAGVPWKPLLPDWIPYVQAPLFLAGLFYSIASIRKIAKGLFERKDERIRSLIPMTVFLSIITIVLLKLFVG